MKRCVALMTGVLSVACVGGQSWSTTAPSLREPSRIAVFNQGVALAGDTPRHSPDGKRIAFTMRRRTANDVAVVPTAGGVAAFLTSNGRSFQPAWSPDGARVAFASYRSDGASDVFFISAAGGTAQPITNGPGEKVEPDWSPDGKLIVYAGNAGGNWAVWSVPAEGGQPKRLTEHAADEWSPRWSADGQWIFFSTNWSIDGDINIWKIRASGGDPVAVTAFRSDEFSTAPSPDGKRIAYLTDMTGLWVMDLTTGTTTNVARGEGFHDIISWSPDGKTLVVGRDPHPAVIKKIGVDGTVFDAAFAKKSSAYAPDISPDGRQIAFHMIDEDGNADIWTSALDGSAPIRMTDHPAVDFYPAWSPDGRWISFMSRREGSKGGDIWKMSAAGSAPQRLTSMNVARFPRWCRGGEDLVFQSDISADGKPHIWAVAATGGSPRQITKGSGEIEPDCHGSRLASSARSGGANKIVIHDLTTGAERKITAGNGFARKPRWSPDGSRIAFLSNKDGAWEIYTILLPDGVPVRITNDGGQKSAPSWSPDGNSLFYSVRVGEPEIWRFPVP